MAKKPYLDEEEKEFIEAYRRGDFVVSPNSKSLRKSLQASASNHLKKNSRINIRISESDLLQLKIKAAEEGMPYQTLISSVLHKFVSGRLLSPNS